MLFWRQECFLYGTVKRNVYSELPTQDLKPGDGRFIGKLNRPETLPRYWGVVSGMRLTSSELDPLVYWHEK